MASWLHILVQDFVTLQSGEAAAFPISMLRSQPKFLQCLIACVPAQPDQRLQADAGDVTPALADKWAGQASFAWQLLAEAHALTILACEAFRQPKQAGGQPASDSLGSLSLTSHAAHMRCVNQGSHVISCGFSAPGTAGHHVD